MNHEFMRGLGFMLIAGSCLVGLCFWIPIISHEVRKFARKQRRKYWL